MVSIKKKQIVEDIENTLQSHCNIALIGFGNTTHQNLESIRRELTKIQAKLKVIKNSLLIKTFRQLSLKDKKYKKIAEHIKDLKNKTAILCLTDDYVPGLSAILRLSKTDESVLFKLGLLDNELYDSEKLKYIAGLPPKCELYSKLIGQIKSPASKLVYLINSPASRLIRILKIKSDSQNKQGGDQ
jgi:ribosomal protein L10